MPEEPHSAKAAGQVQRPLLSRPVPDYALIYLIIFICCALGLVFLWIRYAERLNRFGLLWMIYYLVLVSMGVAAAQVLFGVLQSSASWAGTVLGGKLRLSGSILCPVLVVMGGHFFLPKPTFFPLTVYVHGEGGPQDIVLRNMGRVFLKLGPEITPEAIGENGQAVFPRIPADFRGQQVPGWVESDDYEASTTTVRIAGDNVDLIVKKKIKQFRLAGAVLDEQGRPLPSVQVAMPKYHLSVTTDNDGRFEFQVTAEREEMVDLTAKKDGFRSDRLRPTLGDSDVNFALKRTSHAQD